MHQIYYVNAKSDIKNLFVNEEQNGYDTLKKITVRGPEIYIRNRQKQLEIQGPLIWNSLSNELKKLQNMTTFESNLKKELNYITSFNFQNEVAVNTNKMDNFIYF